MKTQMIKLLGVALVGIGLQSAAQAQAPTCADIEFGSDVLSKAPDVADACDEVIEHNGEYYVKVDAEVLRTSFRTITYRLKHNDGSWGKSIKASPEEGFRVTIDGRKYRIRDLSPGQEISIYLPHDRWAVADIDEGTDTPAVVAPVALAVVEEPAEEELPSTGSSLPLAGLAGVLSVFFASLLMLARRRR